jgi:hypothetical protein
MELYLIMKKIISCLIFLLITHHPAIAAPGANFIESELKNLDIPIVGRRKQQPVSLPTDLNKTAGWGVPNVVCKKAGYNLEAYAGQTLLQTYYPVRKFYRNEPLNVHILSKDDTVVCVYFAVRRGSTLVPGVFSINEPLITQSK